MSLKLLESPESPCLECSFCSISRLGIKSLSNPCTPWIAEAMDHRNPPEYRYKKNAFKLRSIWRQITPLEIRKKYYKPCRARPLPSLNPKDCPEVPRTRISKPTPPWGRVRRGVPAQLDLQTPSPRITTIAHHGPHALLRPFFPEFPEDPKVSIGPEKARELLKKERASNLAGMHNLAMGGHKTTIAELESLEIPKVSEDLQDTEPLRAMALKEVTNIPFLRDYTACAHGAQGEQDD